MLNSIKLYLNPFYNFLLFVVLINFSNAQVLNAQLGVDLEAVLANTFDYIIVGGGNTGLALANRLSVNINTNVLVLEAGDSSIGNPGVSIPAQAGSTFKSSLDWNFNTVAQTHANGRSIYQPRGKVLGGSSALNFLAYTRGNKNEYNAWNSLGNTGWGWSSLLPYFKKSEQFNAPLDDPSNLNINISYDSTVHSTSGPVQVSYPAFVPPQYTGFYNGLTSLNVPVALDLNNGNNIGVGWTPSTQTDPSETRVTSESAYLTPVEARPNLFILTNAQVLNITWAPISPASNGTVTASGVTFTSILQTSSPLLAVSFNPTNTYSVVATKQVILSAGAIQTPQILELSGIGDPTILNPLGINTVVNLPGVGTNLQDHPAVVLVYELAPGYESLDTLGYNSTALTLALTAYSLGQGILTQVTCALAYLTPKMFLSAADQVTAVTLLATLNTGISLIQLAQQVILYLKGVPIVELLSVNVYFGANVGAANTAYISLAACMQHSFSRGTIHITSSNPLTYPAIDPQYLQHPVDTFILSKAAQFIRKVATTSAFAPFLAAETEPGLSVQNDTQWSAWVKGAVRTEYHPVGTAAMLPRSSNGVVNSNLLVYGTSNVRVVDLSIVPLHVSTHPQSLAYAIAEKAADMILAL